MTRLPTPPVGEARTFAAPLDWRASEQVISLSKPVVMGILNVTPDSFSDGGELQSVDAALRRAERMIEEGAGILDVGGESTRPGADTVPEAVELKRVVPVVHALAARVRVPISIDTRKSGVARAALDSGAVIVNDVSAFAFDPEIAVVVAEARAGVVLMHMRGTPVDMKRRARYRDVVAEVAAELADAATRAREAGVDRESIVLDPGIGFAKTAAQSLEVLGGLERLVRLGYPVMVGPSRKSFLGELLDVPAEERVVGTASACVMAYLGGARIFRVHDVAAAVQALAVARAIRPGSVEA